MKKILFAATVLCMMGCQNKPTNSTPALDPSNMDTSVAPNESFYQYATGGWQAKNPLKPEHSSYNMFNVLNDNNEIRINELFTQMTKENPAKGTVNQKIADLYKLGLDSVRLNQEGAAPIRAELETILSLDDKKQLTPILSVMQMTSSSPLFSFGPEADLKKNYDAIDWKYLFDFAKINPERVIVCQPEYMEALDKLIETTPIEDLRYYLASQYLNAAAPYLDDNFYAASFDFYGRTMSGKQEPRPRWKRAMAIPNSALGEAVGEMYVEKFFPAEDKARMMTLVENLRTALGQHIDQLDWMSDSTKMRAREKLAAFHVKIGYPDKWKDYSTLEIDPTLSYWENIQRASEWATRDQLAKVGKAVDPEEWLMTPQTVNAYYNPTTNEICFPAAILQPPFFNPAADDAVNYGAIGVVIGHEMTHGFDDQGRQFDKDGNMNNWWTDADAEAFKQKTDILVKQFDAIEVLPARGDQPAVFANGSLCLGENIADQGGLRVAYTALMNTLNGTEPEPIDGLTPAQRFYLSYATVWAQNIRDEEIARLTKLDVHSLGQWRVDATLRNLQDFFDAFNITDGKMYMPVEERVIIW